MNKKELLLGALRVFSTFEGAADINFFLGLKNLFMIVMVTI